MYQAGVISGLAATLPASEMAYQAVSGVAGGAVNAVILATFAEGEETSAADRMKTFWVNSANTKLYKDWIGGDIEGLLIKGGIWNDENVLDFIRTEMQNMIADQRWVDVGLTDVLKGTYVDYTNEELSSG